MPGAAEAHRTTSFVDWPAADRDNWQRTITPGDALQDAGAGVHWALATRQRYLWAYGRWLTFLRFTNRLNEVSTPADRFDRETVAAFVETLRQQNLTSQSIAAYVEAVHNAIWGMAPEVDWSWLREIRNALKRNACPRRDDKTRLQPVDEILAAAIGLMDEAERRQPQRPFQNEVWFRDGLLLAVGIATGLRRKNLALLELGRHIFREPGGWHIAIPGAEVKNGIAVEGILPETLTPYLDRYVDQHRRVLLQGKHHDALWVRNDGNAYSVNSLSGRFTKVTKRLGIPMSCHDLRRCAATSIAEVRPDLALIIGQFLGHTTQQTSERYYNKAQMRRSSERHASHIVAIRARLTGEFDGKGI